MVFDPVYLSMTLESEVPLESHWAFSIAIGEGRVLVIHETRDSGVQSG